MGFAVVTAADVVVVIVIMVLLLIYVGWIIESINTGSKFTVDEEQTSK